MTRTFTIVFVACAIAIAASTGTSHAQPPPKPEPPAQTPATTEAQRPTSPTPDEWQFTKEKKAEPKDTPTREKPVEQTPAEQTPAEKKPAEKKPAEKKADPLPDSWKMEQEKAREKGTASAGSAQAAGARARAAAKPKAPWKGWSDRAIVSLNGGWQSASFTLRDTRELASPIQGDREQRTMAAEYAVESGVALDLGGIVRVWKGLGAGIAVTRFNDARDITVAGTVPHPFFFNRPRAVSGAIEGTREEVAVHVDAVWVVPVNRRLQIALFGGPTFYSVKQSVVTDFTFSESYPYDEATLTRLVTEDESSSVTGFNAGADVGYYFTKTIGVGGIVRFGRASVDSQLGSLDVGGPAVGVGVRIRIP